MVSQTPVYDNQVRKKKAKFSSNQVIGKSGVIRPDKRRKPRFL